MNILETYSAFNEGCFYDKQGQVKARISESYIITKPEGMIVGYIRNDKVYDNASNYLGRFKGNVLYRLGGTIWGYGRKGNIKATRCPNHESSLILFTVEWIGILIGMAVIVMKIAKAFCIF